MKNGILIGVAGSITTLALLKMRIRVFERNMIEGLDLELESIENILSELSLMNLDAINSIGDYMKGRSDIILSGILILKTFMNKFGFKKIKVSTQGLRYGIFLREVIQN